MIRITFKTILTLVAGAATVAASTVQETITAQRLSAQKPVMVYGPALERKELSIPYTSRRSAEIARLIMTESGLPFEIKPLPWSRSYSSALADPNSVLFMLTRTLPREDNFIWLHQHHVDTYQVIGFDERVDSIASLADIEEKGFIIPCVRDTTTCGILQRQGYEPAIQPTAEGRPMAVFIDYLLRGRAAFP